MIPLLIALFPWAALALFVYLLLTEPPRELSHAHRTSALPLLVARVPLRACARRQGALPAGWAVQDGKVKMDEDVKDTLSATWRGWKLDADAFVRYCRACGLPLPSNSGGVRTAADPFLYPETLFLRHMIALTTSSSFPLSPLGLIHVGLAVRTHGPLSDLLATRCDLRCGVSEIRATDKGFEVDIECSVHDASSADGGILWSSVTTLLSRNKATIGKQAKAERPLTTSQPFSGKIDSYTGKHLDVADDTGLRYATATGDYNPHHLYPWMTRLLGYQRPMVHGMWTLAKVLTAVQAGTLPSLHPPLTLKATFKRPLYIPSKAAILYTKPSKDKEIMFEVRNTEGTIIHVTGTITSI